MKSTYKYIISSLLVAGAMAACSPEEFGGMLESGVPQSSAFSELVKINVDQEINQVSFSTGQAGTYAIWTITGSDGKSERKIGSNFEKIFVMAGDYDVTIQIANRNGVSDGVITKSFHIDNTIVDFTKYINAISKSTWYFDNNQQGHLACGPNAADPTGWWSGEPDCKANVGLYDNFMDFTADKKYTFSPGAAGTMYVNKGTTLWGTGAAEDFTVNVEPQESTYDFEIVGNDIYLTFAANTQFPYIAFDECYTAPRYKVESLKSTAMTLIAANNDIAWQYILTTSHEVKFMGFDVNSEDNLWKQANPTFDHIYYAPGWNQIADFEHSEENGVYTLKLTEATSEQWQAQYFLTTELSNSNVPAGALYDFSCIITPSKDIKNAMLKLTSPGDDPSLFAENVNLEGNADNVIYFTEMEGPAFDGNYKFVFDFGGNPEDVEIVIKDIVVIDHSKNKVVPPTKDPEPAEPETVKDWNNDSPANLWKAVEEGSAFISVTPWFSGADWNGGLTPDWKHENGVWEVVMPAGIGAEQWKGQFPINTTLTASIEKKYNFYCVVEADNDCPGVTIKLTQTDESETAKHDDNFFFADRHEITADKPFIYKATNVVLPKQDAHALSLFFDFGGTPEGTVVKISDIYFEEVKEVNYEAENNLWKAVDSGNAFLSVTPWFSGADWSGGLTCEWDHKNGSDTWKVTMPEGLGSEQWKGQFPINTTLTASKDKTYSFGVTLEADADCPGVTIKLTQTDESETVKHDDNFFFADRHELKADEEYVYKVTGAQLPKGDAHALSLFFDFGGTPGGTVVKIKKITFIEE